ncbi:MAG: hypothetical protein LBJ82_05955 [Deltaproteobacteria bacterium]|jgi:hypothetical protein|nr:hypothetical protein [Deltaproteobacteria bacterium]
MPVDVALNIFAKPYCTSLSLLSLLRCSGRHINQIYLQFEPVGSRYDPARPYLIAEFLASSLGERIKIFQPDHWLRQNPPDPARLEDPAYRLSIRYEFAFEHTQAEYLFIMHNDVFIQRDIIGMLLERAKGAFAVGQVGQCWNCPARLPDLMRAAGCGTQPCLAQSYEAFQPDFAGLVRLYEAARQADVFVRPWWEGWEERYGEKAWPLPECRVNEWACLVDMELIRRHAPPLGPVPPFGAFESCGAICLDTAVAWFRELNRLGLRARHADLTGFLLHFVGTGKKTAYRYARLEGNARGLLEKHFPAFAAWARKSNCGLFAEHA